MSRWDDDKPKGFREQKYLFSFKRIVMLNGMWFLIGAVTAVLILSK
jgi:hypothetical protein